MHRNSRTLLLVACLGALLAVALLGCSGSDSTSGAETTSGDTGSGGTTIVLEKFAFNPSNPTVKMGDTVTFTNNDSVAHNVKIDGKLLGVQNPGESKTWAADKAGTFTITCAFYPAMIGGITVE